MSAVASGAMFNDAGVFYGDVYKSGVLTQASDALVKKNIQTIEATSLQQIMQLKPKSYEYKTDVYKNRHFVKGTH